ncbi:hypothetical protein C8R44DRAFT_948832 [Mycena epipterygia]|nr:hypothetical protein C8R44DRAFT_948832 [Mycena epipterygia]
MYGPPAGLPYCPWIQPVHPGVPTAGYGQPGYPPYPGYGQNWVPLGPPHGPPQAPFPTIYHPPPYPLPQTYLAPSITNKPTIGHNFTLTSSTPDSGHVQMTRNESPSYQWPDSNVKLECTTGQEPDGWDDQGWMWRSSGPRKLGLPEGATKVDKQLCLGVFHCGCIDECGLPTRFFRPKKEKRPREKQCSETCHICHLTLTFEATFRAGIAETIVLLFYHHGRHEHGRPPIKILPAADRAALDRHVRENPQLTAQQLRAGAGPTQVPLGDINPILLGARKARSEVENSRVRQGIIAPAPTRNSGFQLLDSLSSLQESFETPWIVKSDLLDGRFIVMQTPFMREVLLQDQIRSWHEENLEAESGRHGLVTDGCHDFVKQGILLTSLVFSQILMRWAPVLFTWMGKFDEAHHKSHFDQLVYAIAEMCTWSLGYAFDERLYSAILDFSTAQRNGFIEAFIEFMCARIPGWNTLSKQSRTTEAANLRTRALALIKGCIVHWKRSLHKIKQVIGAKFLYRFEGLVAVLERETITPAEFIQAVEQILAEFPEVRPWLAWWILPGNGSMIFPAMQKMPAELRARLPNSTNAAESGHWLLYRAVGTGFDLWEGIRRLNRFQRETEMLYAAIRAGHVDARFQGTKPQAKSRITWHENDGRAPDTRERLAAVEKLEAEFAKRNAKLTDEERWLACNSAPSGIPAPPPSESTTPTALALQSYIWEGNSCFIDAYLEAYFRAFVGMGDAIQNKSRVGIEILQDVQRTEFCDFSVNGQTTSDSEVSLPRDRHKGSRRSKSGHSVTSVEMENLGECNPAPRGDLLDGFRFQLKPPSLETLHVLNCTRIGGCKKFRKCVRIGKLTATILFNQVRAQPGLPGAYVPRSHFVSMRRLTLSWPASNASLSFFFDGLVTSLEVAGTVAFFEDLEARCGSEFGDSMNTSRAVAEIEADFAKIPPPSKEIIPVTDSDSEEDIDQMLIDSITSPVKRTRPQPDESPQGSEDRFFTPAESPRPPSTEKLNQSGVAPDISFADTNSNTLCPLFCGGCGAFNPDGENDPEEVQCEKCRYWSHIDCLSSLKDWADPAVHYICKRCEPQPDPHVNMFEPNQIVMLPDPEVSDWKMPGVLWYPAKFIRRNERREGEFNEYELRWLDCTDGVLYNSEDSALPVQMLQTCWRNRQFCNDIFDITLTTQQQSSTRKIFREALPCIAKILVDFDHGHPTVASFNRFFTGKKKIERHRDAGHWMGTLGLVPTPELEAVALPILDALLSHEMLSNLMESERNMRVMGVGSALLQLLAVQKELDEPYNLNGDLIVDLQDLAVVPCPYDGGKALEAMFGAIPLQSSDSGIILQQMLKFNRDHTIFDAGFRPPTFRRDFSSQFEPSKAIPITLKRKSDGKTDAEQPNKRAKQFKPDVVAGKKKSSSGPPARRRRPRRK